MEYAPYGIKKQLYGVLHLWKQKFGSGVNTKALNMTPKKNHTEQSIWLEIVAIEVLHVAEEIDLCGGS